MYDRDTEERDWFPIAFCKYMRCGINHGSHGRDSTQTNQNALTYCIDPGQFGFLGVWLPWHMNV